MRKILFRGKSLSDGEWVEGSLTIDTYERAGKIEKIFCIRDYTYGFNENEFGTYQSGIEEYIDAATVGQFTGLRDKNGKKIFEGDIIRYGQKNCEIWWNDEAFQWQAKATQRYPYRPTYHGEYRYDDWDNVELAWIAAEIALIGEISTEVIGNIHDNPELMKGEEHGETH